MLLKLVAKTVGQTFHGAAEKTEALKQQIRLDKETN
jgi:hypothetical protein